MTRFKPIPESVRDYFEIDETSPSGLRWIKASGNCKTGDVTGSLHSSGYWIVQHRKKLYKAHRIIWFLHTGEDPGSLEIDHVKGKKNVVSNLRLATHEQNMYNRSAKGYGWHKAKKKWYAYVNHNKVRKSLGYFDTETEAREAYVRAAKQLHGEFWCGSQ